MTAQEYLSQAYRLDQRINSDIAELGRLRQVSLNISSYGFKETRGAGTNTDAPFVKQLEKIMALESRINGEIDRLVDLKTQIRMTINSVQNADERMVLQYRYMDSFSWSKIAKLQNVDRSTIYRRHNRALKNIILPKNPIIF